MFLATIYVPGYLPMDDQPPVFETAAEAWECLAEEREHAEDGGVYCWDDPAQYEYSETVKALRYIASGEHTHGCPHEDWPTDPNGTGLVHGDTPGANSAHDLGLFYSVTWVEG